VFLHHQERRLIDEHGKPRRELLTRADLFVLQFRKWLTRYGGGGPWGNMKLSESNVTKQHLLDRYTHTTSLKLIVVIAALRAVTVSGSQCCASAVVTCAHELKLFVADVLTVRFITMSNAAVCNADCD
jgi:hypothetical protein